MDESQAGQTVPTRRPLATGLSLLLIAGLIAIVVLIRLYLLIGFISILLAVVLSFPINLLGRLMPRGAAVVITLVVLLGGVVGGGWLAAPAVSEQAGQLAQQIPSSVKRLERWWKREQKQSPVAQLPHSEEIAKTVQESSTKQAGEVLSKVLPAAAGGVALISAMVIMLALAFFFAHEPDRYRLGLRALVPREREQDVEEGWRRIGVALRRWMGGILVSMTLMGALTAIGLKIAGIDGWLALGLITFACTFVPYAGAIVSAIPGLAVGLSQSTSHFAYALLVYGIIHLIEGYIVEPLIMKRAVELRPAVLLFWQLIMGALFGAVGIIAATPLLVCVKVGVDFFYIERTLGKE